VTVGERIETARIDDRSHNRKLNRRARLGYSEKRCDKKRLLRIDFHPVLAK
jgi:hypothetical protein